MLEQIKQFIQYSFSQGVHEKCTNHFERTLYWAKQIEPDADEAVLIAAYAHDAARAFCTKDTSETFKDNEFNDHKILREHQCTGARIVADFLRKECYDEEAIQRVYHMIRHHEEGGEEESNMVMDADSISYLEVNAIKHIALINHLGKDKIKRKIEWMYSRISSHKAKEFAGPFYRKAIASLATSFEHT